MLAEKVGDHPVVMILDDKIMRPHLGSESLPEHRAFVFARELLSTGGKFFAVLLPGSCRLLGRVDLLDVELLGEEVGEGVAATLGNVDEEVNRLRLRLRCVW